MHTHSISKKSLAIAAFSTIVEWYDFTLYLYFATVISRVFFGGGTMSVMAALAGFAAAYLMRPLGAAVFGHIGDKYGRKHMMMLSMMLMTAAMFSLAFLPTMAVWGVWAGVLLIVLRCVISFAVGAEYTGVVAYLLEGTAAEKRGFITSLASAASEIGALLAVAVCSLVVHFLPSGELETWGWRIPFVIGGALALLVWISRSVMQESPVFETAQQQQKLVKFPLMHTLRTQKSGIFRSFMISALGSITYYVGITYVPVFLQESGSMTESLALCLSTVAAAAVILVTPFIGALSDRIGRRKVLLCAAAFSIILPFLTFELMANGTVWQALIGAIMLACLAGAVSAVGASATAEQFDTQGRLSGLALGTTMATAVFGGLTPLTAQYFIQETGFSLVPAIMIALVALMVLPVFWKMPETAGKSLD